MDTILSDPTTCSFRGQGLPLPRNWQALAILWAQSGHLPFSIESSWVTPGYYWSFFILTPGHHIHWIFSHLVVLKLTFHPSLIGFATSGHFFGVANPRCFGTPQPQGLAVGQTDGKPSMNTGAGPIGWAAHGSTRWEICFMMFWKPVELIPA